MRLLRNNVGIFYEKGGTIAYLLSPKGIVVTGRSPDRKKYDGDGIEWGFQAAYEEVTTKITESEQRSYQNRTVVRQMAVSSR